MPQRDVAAVDAALTAAVQVVHDSKLPLVRRLEVLRVLRDAGPVGVHAMLQLLASPPRSCSGRTLRLLRHELLYMLARAKYCPRKMVKRVVKAEPRACAGCGCCALLESGGIWLIGATPYSFWAVVIHSFGWRSPPPPPPPPPPPYRRGGAPTAEPTG